MATRLHCETVYDVRRRYLVFPNQTLTRLLVSAG